ncbi:MAG: MATE family efflux transporter [Gammaproteobacteria bacterium]|nr:MATE family efflux transporter [Gammaproteobacteria bacterium]
MSEDISRLPVARRNGQGRLRVDTSALFKIAAPLMVTNAIQAFLNLTDTWFIGRLSTDAVAAMGAIYWLMSCAIFVLGGVGLATQSFVSQADGAGRRARASQCLWNTMWASLAALPLFLTAAFAGGPILVLFNLDQTIRSLAEAYWEPRLAGAFLGAMSWGLVSFFNGIGATRLTFIVAVVTTFANVPANQFFMFWLDMGMAGAAWGTNLAQLIGLLVGVGLLFRDDLAWRYKTFLTWRPRLSMIRRQLAVGFPVGVMYGADVLGVALMQLMVTQVGKVGAAATQIVIMLTSIAYMPALGLASAGTTVVGQAIGAGDREWAMRVGTFVARSCSILMLSVAVFLLVVGPWLMPLFINSADVDAAAVVSMSLVLLLPAACYQMFDGLYFGSSFALRAAGDTSVPAGVAIVLSWSIFVPLSHLLIFDVQGAWISGLPQLGLGALGGWLALMSYAMLLGTVMYLRWRSGRWQQINIWSARGVASDGS